MAEHVCSARTLIKVDDRPDYNHPSIGNFAEHYSRLMFECQRKGLSFALEYVAVMNHWDIRINSDNPDEFFELEGVSLSRALKSAIYHAEECVSERIGHG